MRVLIVEDERAVARTLAEAIQEAGFAVDLAFDGDEGLRLGREFSYDAVVLDLLLPGKHGLSVLRELRTEKPTLPILVLSALDQLDERVDGLDRGADDYLSKPVALKELLARLRAVLRRTHGKLDSAMARIADLEVDLAGCVVRRGGRPLQLTPREYSLLLLFLNHRGQVLGRTEIGEHVVDRVFEPASNLIDVSVYSLRLKLGNPSLIHTVRGVGYRFDAPGSR